MARFNPVQAALANARSQGRSTHKVVDTRKKGEGVAYICAAAKRRDDY